MKRQLLCIAILTSTSLLLGDNAPTSRNKLLEMFRFFYLPFKIDFQLGDSKDEIIPFSTGMGSTQGTVISPEQMQKLDRQWTTIRNSWRAKSLLNDAKTDLNETNKISTHLISHRIAASRGALDSLSIEERIRFKELLKGKGKEIQTTVLQKQFLRSFIEPNAIEKTHFFIVAPNWCASSENYRTLIEAYTRKLAMGNFVLHSIIIEDPKEEIFDSRAMNELFPFSKKYSHESVPRFLLTEVKNGEFTVREEGDALHVLYETQFASHQGFLNMESPIRETTPNEKLSPSLSKLSIR